MKAFNRLIGVAIAGFFSLGFTALSLITLLPAEASKLNRLGYYGVCSYAPISSTLLVLMAMSLLLIVNRLRNAKVE
jgi:hypothetical protein